MTASELVSVVIPACNAAATLDATLCSVRAQGHQALEIIVVNDGSTDRTRAIAEEHAGRDPRVRVLDQVNMGVAAARNTGWRHAQSDLIAFIDADDVWAPTKIERQLQAFRTGTEALGLVYCGSVRIDGDGVVIWRSNLPHVAGDVLEALLLGNFVGNGSNAMVTRQALIHANGFDSALQAANAQGCEDYLLQCRIAERYQFAVVREDLVGYRYLPSSMSSDRPRMLRSWMLVADEMCMRHPHLKAVISAGARNCARWMVFDAIDRGAYAQLPALANLLLQMPAAVALPVFVVDLPVAGIRKIRSRMARLLRKQAVAELPKVRSRFPTVDDGGHADTLSV
jgi:glycosyltransferase involved in cell wall biosynthesis